MVELAASLGGAGKNFGRKKMTESKESVFFTFFKVKTLNIL